MCLVFFRGGKKAHTEPKVQAVQQLAKNQRYISPEIEEQLGAISYYQINDYDIDLLLLLSQGYTQEQIASNFKSQQITPNGLRTIEKRINRLKEELKAKNNPQLVATAKDMGII